MKLPTNLKIITLLKKACKYSVTYGTNESVLTKAKRRDATPYTNTGIYVLRFGLNSKSESVLHLVFYEWHLSRSAESRVCRLLKMTSGRSGRETGDSAVWHIAVQNAYCKYIITHVRSQRKTRWYTFRGEMYTHRSVAGCFEGGIIVYRWSAVINASARTVLWETRFSAEIQMEMLEQCSYKWVEILRIKSKRSSREALYRNFPISCSK